MNQITIDGYKSLSEISYPSVIYDAITDYDNRVVLRYIERFDTYCASYFNRDGNLLREDLIPVEEIWKSIKTMEVAAYAASWKVNKQVNYAATS